MQRVTAFTENEEIYPFYFIVIVAVFFPPTVSYKPGTTTTNPPRNKTEEEGGHVGWRFCSECSIGPSQCGPSGPAGRSSPASREFQSQRDSKCPGRSRLSLARNRHSRHHGEAAVFFFSSSSLNTSPPSPQRTRKARLTFLSLCGRVKKTWVLDTVSRGMGGGWRAPLPRRLGPAARTDRTGVLCALDALEAAEVPAFLQTGPDAAHFLSEGAGQPSEKSLHLPGVDLQEQDTEFRHSRFRSTMNGILICVYKTWFISTLSCPHFMSTTVLARI